MNQSNEQDNIVKQSKLETIINDPKFVNLEKISSMYHITICKWQDVSMKRVSVKGKLDEVLNWAFKELGLSE